MIAIIVLAGLVLMALERWRPATELPSVPGWWRRVALLNLAQLGIVLLGGATWERWLERASVFHLSAHWGRWPAAAVAYLAITFVYYWWHRARHEQRGLWLALHQLHHSPSRLETITSFYKHPLEILVNSLLISALSYGVLGLDRASAASVTLLTALAEYFYHMNLRTPRWVGFFLQRPEMHRLHHETGRHTRNFADLPVWDMLFGSYENPRSAPVACGFGAAAEERIGDMLLGRDVLAPRRPRQGVKIAALLLLVGLVQPLGLLAESKALRGIGFASAASPLPLVFTRFRGAEPFTAAYRLTLTRADGRTGTYELTPELLERLRGPYNRRNPYGAMIAAGPQLTGGERELWASVLRFGLCDGPLARALAAGGEGHAQLAGGDRIVAVAVAVTPYHGGEAQADEARTLGLACAQ